MLTKGFANVTSVGLRVKSGGKEVFMTVINLPPDQRHDSMYTMNMCAHINTQFGPTHRAVSLCMYQTLTDLILGKLFYKVN